MASTWHDVAAAAFALSAALAHGQSSTRVDATIHASANDGGEATVSLQCFGEPTCVGRYTARVRNSGCSNIFSIAGEAIVGGLALAEPGAQQLVVRLHDFSNSDIMHGDGTCSIRELGDFVMTLDGAWDGRAGTMFGSFPDEGGVVTVMGTFTAERDAPAPVFPLTVQASFDTTANVFAEMQFRPQDVGTQGSVYVFAVAPATLVKSDLKKAAHFGHMAKGAKDEPVQCVLAQLSSSGQLTGVSASTMQAYVTGVLSGAGQAVTIVNGVPTANVAGATFYVGYGASATAMMSNGLNRSAATAPGSVQCKPEPPQKGWWWNTAEGGRGYSVEVRGHNIFFAAFHYDVSGRSTWHVATGPTSLDGSLFNGELLAAAGGQTLGGAYPGFPSLSTVGPLTLAFANATQGTMIWPGGTVPIERFNIVPNGLQAQPKANQPESGWWWNPEESGRGFFIEWQDGWVDIAGYMYDDDGNPVWYLGVYETPDIRAISGSWWSYGNGQTMGGAYKPATRLTDNVAPVTVTFSGPDTAIMTLPNGRTTRLQRHRF